MITETLRAQVLGGMRNVVSALLLLLVKKKSMVISEFYLVLVETF